MFKQFQKINDKSFSHSSLSIITNLHVSSPWKRWCDGYYPNEWNDTSGSSQFWFCLSPEIRKIACLTGKFLKNIIRIIYLNHRYLYLPHWMANSYEPFRCECYNCENGRIGCTFCDYASEITSNLSKYPGILLPHCKEFHWHGCKHQNQNVNIIFVVTTLLIWWAPLHLILQQNFV